MPETNPEVITRIGHADPNESPIKINDLIDLLNTLINSEIQGDYRPYIISHTEPPADKRTGYVWVELDSFGRPIANKIWYQGPGGGAWRRVYNGMVGEIRGYSGNPEFDFEANGRGKIGQAYDGWALCNGNNNTPDLSDKFLLGGHMNNADGHVGWSNGWQSFVDGETDQKEGGSHSTLIEAKYLPPLDIEIEGFEYKVDPLNVHDPEFLIDIHFAEEKEHTKILADYGAESEDDQEKFPSLPPFIVVGWIAFIGYDRPAEVVTE